MQGALAVVLVAAMGEVDPAIEEEADAEENPEEAVEAPTRTALSTMEDGGHSAAAAGGDGSSAKVAERSTPAGNCFRR